MWMRPPCTTRVLLHQFTQQHCCNTTAHRLVRCYATQAPPQSTPPRFYADDSTMGSLARADAGHLIQLSQDEGDPAEVCDLQGTLGRGVLRTALALPTSSGRRRNATDGNSVCIQLTQAPLVVPVVGLQWEVWVACGSLKGGRADWLVEKCVELGAAALVPLLTQRSPTCSGDAGDDGSAPHKRARTKSGGGGGGRVQRWQRLAVAAAKQSLRVHGMRIEEPASLEAMLATLHNAPPAVALLATGGAPPILSVLGAAKRPPGDARGVLLVGPEGDFTPEEMEAIVAAGALPVGLGELRLRVETAALSGLSAARAWAFGI